MKFQEIVLLSLIAGSASALQGIWQQCGGQNWTGGTTCTAGNTCVFRNTWYSQCRPGGTTTSTTTSSSTSASPSSNPSGLGIGVTYKATFTVYGAGMAPYPRRLTIAYISKAMQTTAQTAKLPAMLAASTATQASQLRLPRTYSASPEARVPAQRVVLAGSWLERPTQVAMHCRMRALASL